MHPLGRIHLAERNRRGGYEALRVCLSRRVTGGLGNYLSSDLSDEQARAGRYRSGVSFVAVDGSDAADRASVANRCSSLQRAVDLLLQEISL